MKNIFKKGLIILMVFAMLATVACNKSEKSEDFKTGSFNGKVFTNEWTNMKFEFPEDFVIASQDEIKELVKQGNAGMYADNEKLEKAMNKAAELKLAYDFMVASADNSINFQLSYENLSLSVGGTSMDEKQYLDTALKPILENEDLGYSIINEEKVTIAGKEFLRTSVSGYNGAIRQDMYCHKIENRMMVLAVTYVPDFPEAAETVSEIISKISTAK